MGNGGSGFQQFYKYDEDTLGHVEDYQAPDTLYMDDFAN